MKYLVVHHSGGIGNDRFASSKHLSVQDIDIAHRYRWPDFISQLGWYVGYNAVILPSGEMVQTRLIGEETAAVLHYNKEAISLCLTGNFTWKDGKLVDEPTLAQTETLKRVMIAILENRLSDVGLKVAPITSVHIPLINIIPHRKLQMTECYGNGLSDTWARDLIIPYFQLKLSLLQKLLMLYKMLFAKKQELGASLYPCHSLDVRG